MTDVKHGMFKINFRNTDENRLFYVNEWNRQISGII